jgi:hypothetical protein
MVSGDPSTFNEEQLKEYKEYMAREAAAIEERLKRKGIMVGAASSCLEETKSLQQSYRLKSTMREARVQMLLQPLDAWQDLSGAAPTRWCTIWHVDSVGGQGVTPSVCIL